MNARTSPAQAQKPPGGARPPGVKPIHSSVLPKHGCRGSMPTVGPLGVRICRHKGSPLNKGEPLDCADSHWTFTFRCCLLPDLSGASRQLPFQGSLWCVQHLTCNQSLDDLCGQEDEDNDDGGLYDLRAVFDGESRADEMAEDARHRADEAEDEEDLAA